ncbi:MAG: hypothetical protein K2Q09_03280, partial [Phycisphaerales bacterium]|nr:hypothetical protein [Phycisphaerales bacterium]
LEAEQYSTWTKVGVDELYWSALFWFAIALIGCLVIAVLLYLIVRLIMSRSCLNCRRRYREDRQSNDRNPSNSSFAQNERRKAQTTFQLWIGQALMNLILFGYLGLAAMSYLQIYYYFTASRGSTAAATIAIIVLVIFHLLAIVGIVFFLRYRKQRIYSEPGKAVVFSALFLTYKPRYNAFWIVLFVRNFFLALFVGVLPDHPVAQVSVLLAVICCYLLLCIALRPHLRMYYWILELWSCTFICIVCIVLLIIADGSLSGSQNYIAEYTLILTTYVFLVGYVLICLPGFIAFLSNLLFGLSFQGNREQLKRRQALAEDVKSTKKDASN